MNEALYCWSPGGQQSVISLRKMISVSLHMLICEVSLGTWLNSHRPLFGGGRIPIELVTGWRAGLVCERGKVVARPCGPRAKLPTSTGLSSLSELCADHACHRHVYVPGSCRKKAFLRTVLIWRTHLANLVPLSLLIALSLEGLSGRAPSVAFLKQWNCEPVYPNGCESWLFDDLNSSSLCL